MGGLTNGVFIYNQLTFQEVVVETSGVGADRETGGMQMNIIQRDGGNTFSGGMTYSMSGPDFESANITDELVARNLSAEQIGGLKKYYDLAFAMGGPIKRDRVWFFGSFRSGDNQQLQQGNYYNKRQGHAVLRARPEPAGAYRPVVEGPHAPPDRADRAEAQDRRGEFRRSRTATASSICWRRPAVCRGRPR